MIPSAVFTTPDSWQALRDLYTHIYAAAAVTAVSGENGGENGGENKICCGCCGDFRSCFHHTSFLTGPGGFVYSYVLIYTDIYSYILTPSVSGENGILW